MVTLFQLGCKVDAWFSCFHMFIVIMILCFFDNITQDMRYEGHPIKNETFALAQ